MQGTTISITTGTILKAVLILAAAWLIYALRDIVLIVLTAVVIASAIEPAVNGLARRKVPRLLAVLLIYVLLFAFFIGLFYFFLPSIMEDILAFLASLPAYLELLNRIGVVDEYTSLFGFAPVTTESADELMAAFRTDVGGFFGQGFSVATNVFGGVLSFVLIVVFSFYFAVIATGVDDFLRIIVPSRYVEYVLDLWRRSQRKIGLWMQGQLILAAIIGTLVYLGLTVLGVKHALLLAVVASVFELIPVFGPTLAAIPAIIIGFVDGGPTIGFLVVALYIIIQQFENHLIYPLVVTKVVGVPPLLVILALIIGAKLAGFLGILLSVPVAATLQELVRDVTERRVPLGAAPPPPPHETA
ncbi:hypothetical protein COU20_00825 [Candidatus Kaiserbacteria bacterium CG10_big_fil_rev_8_21_14_0_10_59_10]|uniref:AI-2E family transporter n=1 Tax=Candidatus Kaiserbacteria bacterium CG10_big_fil_rev_8_21_14_0_10_59_10 TaxID=1974612 RepID=A0A2H0U8H0_9BACT|nr:MAG: hypothetical protein COU20_00825 [Candidatus Kaiserbacteria bacterium CG10_big_fil_rev_8_21_14_0_10_59_10]